MKPAIKIALLFSAAWILLKMVFLATNVFQHDINFPGLLNNLLLLLSVAVGLYLEKKKEGFGEGTALSDIKNGMMSGTIYVVIVSGFLYFYYDSIHPEFIENRVTERIDMLYHEMERDTYMDSLKLQNPELKVLTKDEIMRAVKTDVETNLSAKSIFYISLLGLIVLSLTYAILITVIFQKILFKEYYDGKKK